MKKIGYVMLGIVVSVALYMAITFLVISPIQESSGQSPESFLGIAFMIAMPICLIVGSMVSGYLLQPLIIKRSIFSYLLLSPGFYAAIVNLLPVIINASGLLPNFILFSSICSSVWLIVSVIGTRLGVLIKDKKSNQSIHQMA